MAVCAPRVFFPQLADPVGAHLDRLGVEHAIPAGHGLPDADHTPAWKVASRFRELREDEFTGGFVLRRFEDFASAEARTWWVDGTHRLTTAHPDTPDDTPPHIDLSPFAPLIGSLALPFVTADLARRTDGIWRLIELGDGQVSDRPETAKADYFLSAILALRDTACEGTPQGRNVMRDKGPRRPPPVG